MDGLRRGDPLAELEWKRRKGRQSASIESAADWIIKVPDSEDLLGTGTWGDVVTGQGSSILPSQSHSISNYRNGQTSPPLTSRRLSFESFASSRRRPRSPRPGHRVSLVATVETRDNCHAHGHLCRGILSGQRFRLQADIPVGTNKITILGGQVSHLRGPIVKVDEKAALLIHKPKDFSCLFQLIETCSGLGGLGEGAKHAGWRTVVHNDKMPSFCNHLRKFGDVPVVEGDIGALSTVAQLHAIAPYAASMALGFACQPFSRLGDRREGNDDRAQSLPSALYAAFLLQLDLLITECVPEASTSPFVIRCLQHYMHMTNSDRTEALLELLDVWPSRRRRWWSVIMKSFMWKVSIPPLPKLSVPPTVACLLPCLLSASPQELEELVLSTEERIMFERYGKGLGGHMLNFAEPLATALHSWANQGVECACGCRGPLSPQRLMSQGLFGVLAHVPGQSPDQNVRHLSGREMALLTGFPKAEGWSDRQRLLTAGIGQVASPIQSSWIFAAVLNHLIDNGFSSGEQIPPKQILACVAAEVFRLRDEWFAGQRTVSMDMFQEQIEGFLAPAKMPDNPAPPSFQDLTPSQDRELSSAIASIEDTIRQAELSHPEGHTPWLQEPNTRSSEELKAETNTPEVSDHRVEVVMPRPDAAGLSYDVGEELQVHETVAGLSPISPAHVSLPDAPAAKSVAGVGSVDPAGNQELANSQRTGRKDLEEQRSGATKKQPATGTPGPVEEKFKQTAEGTPEPHPIGSKLPPTLVQATPLEPPVGPSHVHERTEERLETPSLHPCQSGTSRVVSTMHPATGGLSFHASPGHLQSVIPACHNTSETKLTRSETSQSSGKTSLIASPFPATEVPDCTNPVNTPVPAVVMRKRPFGHDEDDQRAPKKQCPALTLFQATPRVSNTLGPSHDAPLTTEESITPKGGLSAFSSVGTPAPRPATSTVNVHAPSREIPDQKLHHQQLAQAILHGGIILYDMETKTYHSTACAKNQTAGDLKQAVASLTHQEVKVFDLLGTELCATDSLDGHKLLAISSGWTRPQTPIAVRSCEVQTFERKEALFRQYGAVATDEMEFYLKGLRSHKQIQMVAPLILTDLAEVSTLAEAWVREAVGFDTIVASAIWHRHHWIPVVLSPHDGGILFQTTEAGIALWPLLFPVALSIDFHVQVPFGLPEVFDDDCGFQTFAWITYVALRLPMQPMTYSTAIEWRALFWQDLLAHGEVNPNVIRLLGGKPCLPDTIGQPVSFQPVPTPPQRSPPTLFQATPQDRPVGPSHEVRSRTPIEKSVVNWPWADDVPALTRFQAMPGVSNTPGPSPVNAQESERTARTIASLIHTGHLVVLHFDSMKYHVFSPDQAGVKFAHAMLRYFGKPLHFIDLLGRPISPDSVVGEHRLVAVSSQVSHLASQLSVRTCDISTRSRLEALFGQAGAVATDEMSYYLSRFARDLEITHAPPLICDKLTDEHWQQWQQQLTHQHSPTISAIWHDFHWIPIISTVMEGVRSILTTEQGSSTCQAALPFLSLHTDIVGRGQLPFAFADDCGFQTLAWLKHALAETAPTSLSSTSALGLRLQFWQFILSQSAEMSTDLVRLGGQTELETAVAAILREHGVFTSRVTERSKTLIQQLGAQPLTQALRSTRPWAAIKSLANAHSPKIRLILEDEFNQVVKSRSGKEGPFGTKKRAQPKQAAVFTAQDIAIPEGVFCQQDGTPLAQIHARHISSSARGVVVLSEVDLQPYVQQKQVSKESLAFIVLAPFASALQELGETIRFPAQSVATGEPILLTAVLLQKGSSPVCRMTPPKPLSVETIPTQTIKLLLYRDQVQSAWEEVVDRPVKIVLDLLPSLRLCKQPDCRCACWHPTDSQPVEPILDIWQRDWLTLHFKKSKPLESAIFTCMLRITAQAFATVDTQSGTGGLYIEARAHDGRAQDERFHTVWMPKSSFEEALARQSTADMSTSLIRVTNRYGLRVAEQQAKDLHNLIRTAKSTWTLGPVPYGTTRKALTKLFETWNWPAKPLQPMGPSADRSGLRWQVVASSPPEHYVYTLAHGDVLIVKSDSVDMKTIAAGQAEASAVTRGAVAQQQAMQDPWAAAASRLPSNQQPNLTSAQISSLEASIEQRLLQKIQPKEADAVMTPADDSRIVTLEQQMHHLQQQQQGLSKQHQALESKVDKIGSQVEAHTQKLQNHMDERLADQFSRIEALLSKRPRQE
eukprot:s31_g26.t1